MHTTVTRRRRRWGVLLAVPLAIGLLPACSGTIDSTGSADESLDPEQAWQDWTVSFAACMREEGISDYPDPSADGVITSYDVDPATAEQYEAALAACQKQIGDPPGGTGENEADEEAQRAEALKRAQCLRDEGFDVKDPGPNDAQTIPEGVSDETLRVCGFGQ